MWDLPRPGLEPVSPALAGGFLTTASPGKSPSPVLTPDLPSPDLVLNGGDIHYSYDLLSAYTCLTQFYVFLMYHLIYSSWQFCEVEAVITLILKVRRLRHGRLITCSRSQRGGRAVSQLGSVDPGATSWTLLPYSMLEIWAWLGSPFRMCVPRRVCLLSPKLQVINCLNLQNLRSQSECKSGST